MQAEQGLLRVDVVHNEKLLPKWVMSKSETRVIGSNAEVVPMVEILNNTVGDFLFFRGDINSVWPETVGFGNRA